MAIDVPATIAILGAGPLGLEAALYARFLGYHVALYERGAVCEHVRQRRHARLSTPFAEICSPLGLAALAAQDPQYRPPAGSAVLTGQEWLDAYLLPLAGSDLLVDCLHEQTTVLRVSRVDAAEATGLGEGDEEDEEEEAVLGFRVLIRERDGRELWEPAQAVIDTTGVLGNALEVGSVNQMVHGETDSRARNVDTVDCRADRALREECRPPLPLSAQGKSNLLQPAVHGYILGAKSRSGVEGFSFVEGLRQIRDVFAILGGRADLDLYATIKS